MKPKHPRFTKHQKWLKQNMSIFNEIFNSCWTRMMRILSLRHMVTGQRPNTLSSLKLSHCQMVGIEPCRRIHERFISFMWKETSEPMTSKSASPPEFASPKKIEIHGNGTGTTAGSSWGLGGSARCGLFFCKRRC